MVLFLVSGFTYADSIQVTVNEEYLEFDVPPMIDSGRTMVPLRAIFEKLGAEIQWDGATKTITATKESTDVVLQIGNSVAKVNGVNIELDVPAKVVNGRTLVPVRFVSEAMGSVVGWNGSTRTVEIESAQIFSSKLQRDMTWTKDEGPYIIKKNFKVADDVTLLVESGVTIYTDMDFIHVVGTLEIKGTEAEPVTIIDRTTDKVCKFEIEGEACTLEYLNTTVPVKVTKSPNFELLNSQVPSVEIEYSPNSIIKNSTFSNSDYGVRLFQSDYSIVQSNVVQNAYKGLFIRDSKEIDVAKNVIENCDYGIISNTNWNSKFYHNTVTGSKEYGISIINASNANSYYENNFYDNEMNALVDISANEFHMENNHWGTHKAEIANSSIKDWEEDRDLPKVLIEPFSIEKFETN